MTKEKIKDVLHNSCLEVITVRYRAQYPAYLLDKLNDILYHLGDPLNFDTIGNLTASERFHLFQ